MTKPKLYYSDASPASRATLLTINALELDVELVYVNLLLGENFSPEYLKKNPLHQVPTLEDGDFTIFDSHAINPYLVGKYGKNDSLYPKNLQKRAIIDQRLHFDSGVLFARMSALTEPLLRRGANSIDKNVADLTLEAYQSLETLLDGHKFVAGDEMTVADFSLVASVSTLNAVFVPVPFETHPKISAWFERMKALPYYKVNEDGVQQFKNIIGSKLA